MRRAQHEDGWVRNGDRLGIVIARLIMLGFWNVSIVPGRLFPLEGIEQEASETTLWHF
jgi:hypothetical protein